MKKITANQVSIALQKKTSQKHKEALQRFFKTGPGEYGEGDVFWGIKVPEIRKITKEFKDLNLTETQKLIKSKYHEERLAGLLLLVLKYKKANDDLKEKIFNLYIKSTRYINNWDLVDLTAHHIVGCHLYQKDNKLICKFAKSNLLWERRIAMIAMAYNISQKDYKHVLKIAKILLHDEHDLIHKAVGWMLREVGKRDLETEEQFLKQHYKTMPRTMLRYAIEKFEEGKRQRYLKGKIN
jgi:3-methyladenine DNA glycosylase AlkD